MARVRWILGIFLILGLATPAAGENPTGESLVELKDVAVEPREDGVKILIRTNGPASYRHSLIDTPYRVVIDLTGTQYAWRKTPLSVDLDPLRQIRGSQYRKGVTRVVLQLSRKAAYQIEEGPEGLTVTLERSPVTAATQKPPKAEATEPKIASPKAGPEVATAEAASPPSRPEPSRTEPPKPAAEAVPKVELAKPAQKVTAKAAQPTADIPKPALAEPKQRDGAPEATPVLTDTGSLSALARIAQAQSAQAPPPTPGQRLLSLDFKDADIINLLRILAAESGKNIVAGEDVKGKLSISLKNVTWEMALDTILEVKGFQKIEKDNIIRVVSAEQLTKEREAKARAEEAKLKAEADVRAKIAEAQIKEQEVEQRRLAAELARKEAEARGPLKEELIRLAYRDPEDVAKTLIGLLGIPPEGVAPTPTIPVVPQAGPPFSALYGPGAQPPPPGPGPTPPAEVLAKGITIRADKPTNSIFIRHYEADLERIKKLIKEKLDIPLPQVKIEARLNELSRTDLFEVGIRWGGAGTLRDSNKKVFVTEGFATQPAGTTTVSPPIQTALGTRVPLSAFLPVDKFTGLPLGANIVSLPLTSGTPFGSIGFGIIGTRFNLNLILDALEKQGKTRSLSKPEIVTVENSKASISLGSEIPFATVSSAGTQVQFKDAVLKLEVTPTVIREGDVTKIKLKVVVEDNSKGADVPSGGGTFPSINKRKAETEVIVKEGDALVIGGITQRLEAETIRKVPLLGDIPILGWLFKARQLNVDPNRELIVFITPSVLKTELPKPAQSHVDKPKKGS